MRTFIEENLKKMELISAITALLIFIVGNAIGACEMIFGVIPFAILAVVTILIIYRKTNSRVCIWFLMSMEFILFLLDAFGVCEFHPSTIGFVLDKVISYEMSLFLIMFVQIFILYLMPILKQGGLFIYSVGMSLVCLVAMIVDEGVSLIILANVMYYMTFSILSYELNTSNQLDIYTKLLGYIVDISDNEKNKEYPVEVDGLEEAKSSSQNLREKLQVAVEQKKEKIVFQGEKFLIDDYEDSQLTFELKYGETITLVAVYFYDFTAQESNTMLRRKSMLDQTFCDIGLRAKVNIELDIDYMEEGIFAIHLLKCGFENTDIQGLVDKMYEFMKVIILLNNSKLY